MKTNSTDSINLGLVCQTYDETIRFKHITKTRFDKIDQSEKLSTLANIYSNNLTFTIKCVLDNCWDTYIRPNYRWIIWAN